MLLFSIIAIVIIFFLWFNTSVYDYRFCDDSYKYKVDENSERRLPFTIRRVLGLALLLIPIGNIVLFIAYLCWYIKRACEPDDKYECIIWNLNIKKYSPLLYKIVSFIGNILNKRIV